MVLKEGNQFGNYKVISELGQGAYATVYLAKQRYPKREVALKVLHPIIGRKQEQKSRFLREIELIAKIHHPNIVRVFEAGEVDDYPYYSMEYIPGDTLVEKLNRGLISQNDVLQIVRIVAGALDYAHKMGIVHRDVKPSNILIDKTGNPFLADFGSARDLYSTEYLTMTGFTIGTPHYMSPEQARGDMYEVDERSDVWSLGVILYEAIAKKYPFEGETPNEVMNKIKDETPPSVRKIIPDIGKDLDTICMKCLDKVKARRYQSSRELADDIKRYLDGEPILARPRGTIERFLDFVRSHPLEVGSTALILFLLFASLFFYIRDQKTKLRTKAQISALDFNNAYNQSIRIDNNMFLSLFYLDRCFEISEQGNIDKAIHQRTFLSLGDFFRENHLPLIALRSYLKVLDVDVQGEEAAKAITAISEILFSFGEFEQAYQAASFSLHLEDIDEETRERPRAVVAMLETFWPEEKIIFDRSEEGGIDLVTSGDTDGDGEEEIILSVSRDRDHFLLFVPRSRIMSIESLSPVPVLKDFPTWNPHDIAAGNLDGRPGDEIAMVFTDESVANVAYIVVMRRNDSRVEIVDVDTIDSNIREISIGNTDLDEPDEMVIGVIYPERISRVYDLVEVDGRFQLSYSLLRGMKSGFPGRNGDPGDGDGVKFARGDAGAVAIADVIGDSIKEVIVTAGFPNAYQVQIFGYDGAEGEDGYSLLHSFFSGDTQALTTMDLDDDGKEEILFNAYPPPALSNSFRFPASTAGLYLFDAGRTAVDKFSKPTLLLETPEKFENMFSLSSGNGARFLVSDIVGEIESSPYPTLSDEKMCFLVFKGGNFYKIDYYDYFEKCKIRSTGSGDLLVTIPVKSSNRFLIWNRASTLPLNEMNFDRVSILNHDLFAEDGVRWEEYKDWIDEIGNQLERDRIWQNPVGEHNKLAEYLWFFFDKRNREPTADLFISIFRLFCQLGKYGEASDFLNYLTGEWVDSSPTSVAAGFQGSTLEELFSHLGEIVSFLQEDPRHLYMNRDRELEKDLVSGEVLNFTIDVENQQFLENGIRASRKYAGTDEAALYEISSRPRLRDEWSCYTTDYLLKVRGKDFTLTHPIITRNQLRGKDTDSNELTFGLEKKSIELFIFDEPLDLSPDQGFQLDFKIRLRRFDLGDNCEIGIFQKSLVPGSYRVLAGMSFSNVWNPVSPTGFHRTVYELFRDDRWIYIYHVKPFENLDIDHNYHCTVQYIPELKRLRTSVLAPDYDYSKSLLHYKEIVEYDPSCGNEGSLYLGILLFNTYQRNASRASVEISDIKIRTYE